MKTLFTSGSLLFLSIVPKTEETVKGIVVETGNQTRMFTATT